MHTFRKLLFGLLLGSALPALTAAQVDLNGADAKTLAESLTGIGLVKAEAIVAYRTANGPFKSVEDLLNVAGIGARFIDANRDAIVIVDAKQPRQPLPRRRGEQGKSSPYAS